MSNVQKTYDAVVVTGEYTDNQGNQKKSYMNIGTLFVYNDNGMSLKLDAAPIGNGNISFYEKRAKQQQGQQGHSTSQGMNNPSPQQQQGYQQGQHVAQNLPRQNQNTHPQQGYDQGQPVYDQNGVELPL